MFCPFIQIYAKLFLVAMVTKFGTKWAITRLLLEISLRSLRLYGGLLGWAIEYCQQNFTPTDFCCMTTKFETRSRL